MKKCSATYYAGCECDLPLGHTGDHVHNVTPDGGIHIQFPESAIKPPTNAAA